MKEQTVSLGTKIVAANEKLTSINMIDLFEMIAHPEPSLRNQTEVLRSIQRMDSAKYNLMKNHSPTLSVPTLTRTTEERKTSHQYHHLSWT